MSNKKTKRGCLNWLRKCFLEEETITNKSTVNPNNHISGSIVNNYIINNNNNYNNMTGNSAQQPVKDESTLKIKAINEKIIIDTKVDKTSLNAAEAFYEETKFNCPICLKYYSNILLINCCKNYICIYCAEEYKNTHLKYDFQIKCPFCEYDKIMVINDVDTDEPNKIYSDSPIIRKVVRTEAKSNSIINLQQ